jgi:hypothetical protein
MIEIFGMTSRILGICTAYWITSAKKAVWTRQHDRNPTVGCDSSQQARSSTHPFNGVNGFDEREDVNRGVWNRADGRVRKAFEVRTTGTIFWETTHCQLIEVLM